MINKNIRIILTAIILLVGGYFIQQSSMDGNMVGDVINSANADIPEPVAPGNAL